MELELTFSSMFDEKYDIYEEKYEELSKKVFNHLKLEGYFIFEVNLVDLDFIHSLNKKHRNIDKPTDVISFAFEDNVDGSYCINKSNDVPRILGEIFICIEKAKEQANEYNHSFEREMSFLFVHGLLHLLGYDHMKKEDEDIMFKLQDEILDTLNL